MKLNKLIFNDITSVHESDRIRSASESDQEKFRIIIMEQVIVIGFISHFLSKVTLLHTDSSIVYQISYRASLGKNTMRCNGSNFRTDTNIST